MNSPYDKCLTVGCIDQWFYMYSKSVALSGRLRTAPTFVTAHTFCASRDTQVSYGWCLLIQGYFCKV